VEDQSDSTELNITTSVYNIVTAYAFFWRDLP